MARRRPEQSPRAQAKKPNKAQAKESQKEIQSYLKQHPWILIALVAILLLCALFYWFPQGTPSTAKPEMSAASSPADELTVHMIDVGQGDATLIRQGDAAMLIDAGVTEQGDTVIAYLKSQGIERLQLVVATHAHADHIGGMTRVLKAFPVDTFVMKTLPDGVTPTTTTYERMLNTLLDRNVPVREAAVGDTYRLGDATVRILGPVRDFEKINDQSVVCLVTYGDRRFLFTGDAEYAAETALLKSGQDLTADVLKAGHHGSSDASSWSFLEAVQPSIALISCGKNNDYGHPHQELLKRFSRRSMEVYRTDQQGAVVVHTDGQSLSVTTEKGGNTP
ncbi:MAG: MBL fold metallo-hydrolase [Clostridia bacterium]|nr:MBL fold metallo-hydrolase [Clostridia bacterium]